MISLFAEIVRNFLIWCYVLITVPTFWLVAIITKRHSLATIWCEGLLWLLGLRIKVSGHGLPPRGRQYVFFSNHQSQLDVPVLEKVLRDYNIRFLAKKSLFKIPFFGWGIGALGYIPVDRDDPREGLKSIIACVESLKKDRISLVVFPEGTRSATGELLPFKIGGFLVPLKAGVAICPLVIIGTRDVLPKGSLWFNLRKRKEIIVTIGPVIEVEGLSLKDKTYLAEEVRKFMEGVLEENKKFVSSVR